MLCAIGALIPAVGDGIEEMLLLVAVVNESVSTTEKGMVEVVPSLTTTKCVGPQCDYYPCGCFCRLKSAENHCGPAVPSSDNQPCRFFRAESDVCRDIDPSSRTRDS